MDTSTSTRRESTESRDDRSSLTVVVASNGAPGSLERCLGALAPQLGGAELIVCCPDEPAEALRRTYPDAAWLVRPGALVPVLWRDGIERAHGDLVALTISPMAPRADWVASLRTALRGVDAVGGAIEPAPGLRAVDRAECYSRYARDLLPFPAGPSLDLAGDNAAYRRATLAAVAGSWSDGFWEPQVHAAISAGGGELRRDPAVVVEMGRSAGARAFLRQRIAHGREFGWTRGRRAGRLGNLVRLALTPAVPFVLVARTLREAGRRGRRRELVPVLPLVFAFDVAWAAGEALGHVDALRGR